MHTNDSVTPVKNAWISDSRRSVGIHLTRWFETVAGGGPIGEADWRYRATRARRGQGLLAARSQSNL